MSFGATRHAVARLSRHRTSPLTKSAFHCAVHYACEALEGRTLLAIDFPALATFVGNRLLELDASLGTVDQSANKLPVANKRLTEIAAFRNAITTIRTPVLSGLNAITTQTVPDIQQAIFNALGPAGANLLDNKDADPPTNPIQPDDIVIDQIDVSDGTIHFDINLRKAFAANTESVDFGLGLDSVPLRGNSSSNVQIGVGWTYKDFQFGAFRMTPGGLLLHTLDTSEANEFSAQIQASQTAASFGGHVGLVPVTFTDVAGHACL